MGYKRFCGRTMLALLPIFLLAALYLVCDPFRVLRDYDSFYDPADSVWVNLNADYVATCTYDRQYDSLRYDAIIFGNSRSRYYQTEDWLRHLPKGSCPFHYDAHNESLYALLRKVEYIERKGRPLRHALVVLDKALLEQDKAATPHLNYISPQLEGNTLRARMGFQAAFFKAWFSPKFIYTYLDARLSGKMRPYMAQSLYVMRPYAYNPLTNEEYMENEEARIAAGTYYEEADIIRCFKGKQHPGETSPTALSEKGREELQKLAEAFHRMGTDVRVVVSPLYDQIRLNPEDVAALQKAFGADRVHDFSGTNAFTSDKHNFYEPFHYRPVCARQIMDCIYQ
ncbi:MAG: hypothetical protein IJ659_03650 [Alloprevotella sp.]|nr:hypothetical protein [Alloprevotella sp.]